MRKSLEKVIWKVQGASQLKLNDWVKSMQRSGTEAIRTQINDWVLIASVPDLCILFTYTVCSIMYKLYPTF